MGTTYSRCIVPKPNVARSAVVNPFSYTNKSVTRIPRADVLCPTPCVDIGEILREDADIPVHTIVVFNGIRVVFNNATVIFEG